MTPLPSEIQRYIREVMPLMDGWCTAEKAESLARTALETRPRIAIEIGVYSGRSLLAIALGMKANGYGRVIGIDPWMPEASTKGFENDPANRDWWGRLDHNAIYQQCVQHIEKLNVGGYVALFDGTSEKAATLLTIHEQPFVQLLHIDGNHSEQQALQDVELYVPMVVPGGTVYFDDLCWSTTKAAQKRLVELCEPMGVVTDCGIFRRR